MVPAMLFSQDMDKARKEREALESRIDQAYCNAMVGAKNRELFNEDGSIKSPFEKGYQITSFTKGWLMQYGWTYENDKICPMGWKENVTSE